jgi:type IV secretion system protein VirD4
MIGNSKYNNKYFASQAAFERNLSIYSLADKTLRCPYANQATYSHAWGLGGVPLSYSMELGKVYVDASDTHTLIIGPTASKKSRLVAMPAVKILGAARESMIITDPKAEIYSRTASELKELGYNILMLNLREPSLGSAWNPLSIPYRFYCQGDIDRASEFANDISMNLTAMEKSNKDPFWDNSAGSFFFGLTLLLFKYCQEYQRNPDDVNIANVFKLRNKMCSGSQLEIRNNPLWKYAKEDDLISSALIGTIEAPNDTRASILSVFDQKMRAFAIQPNLLTMLAFNDFDFSTLTQQPMAMFLILPDEKTSYHGLVSLFIKQSYEYIIFNAQSRNQNLQHRVNYILDEFSSLPTVNDFPAMITAARSRNIRFNIFIQSKHQLQLRYAEEADTILANCTNWIFLTSRELSLLSEISQLCGNKDGTQDNQPILSIADLQRFDKEKGEVLILCGRQKPYIANLPDINKYDSDKIKELGYQSCFRKQKPTLDFKLPDKYAMNPRAINPNSILEQLQSTQNHD